MDDPPINQRDYVRRLLEAYRATPGTSGAVRRPDRLLAAQLHERGVPLEAVENAFVLAATRRMIRTADAAPLGTIRSLAYFSPVIEEVLQLQVSQEYFQYLRHKLQHAATARYKPAPSPNEIPHHTQRASGADEIAAYPRRNGRTPAAWTMRAHPRSCSWNGSLQPSATGSLLVSSEDQGERRSGRVRNTFSAGTDLDWQFTNSLRHPNLGNAVENASLLADADITQRRVGAFFTDRLAIGDRWTLLGSLRFDSIVNQLTDKLKAGGLDLSGSANFSRVTGRLGVTRSITKDIGLYVSWGQGFLPPATEELYANPATLGGFNRSLKPATSAGEEVGARGSALSRLFWDVAFFRLDTRRDFERYRVESRPLETFYGNAGESRRYGLESSLRWLPVRGAFVTASYPYSNFNYTKYDSLTYPGNLTGNELPNSPRQQFYIDTSWEFARNWTVGAGTQAWGRAFIDPTNHTWIDGYGLLNARFSRSWQRRGLGSTLFLAGRNLTAQRYIAFTEPDPDGNSYQPGAGREIFAGLQLRF